MVVNLTCGAKNEQENTASLILSVLYYPIIFRLYELHPYGSQRVIALLVRSERITGGLPGSVGVSHKASTFAHDIYPGSIRLLLTTIW